MNWLDEGSLYSQIGLFLREDLGRGDITTQAIVARNTRARGRFVAGQKMVVAGLEAAEEVFLTLDSQQQLEAFASDGEELDGGKVIARTTGFADVLLSGERVALNLLQRLSGIATLTNQYVRAVAGTNSRIVDSRATTPGLRMLEKYAVLLGGGQNHRFGLDDGVVITANHASVAGGIGPAVKAARERLGRLHKIQVRVATENDVREAASNGADLLSFESISLGDLVRLISICKELAPSAIIEYSGNNISPDNVASFAEAGVDMICVEQLTSSAPSMQITFQIQLF
jgi:nicotinate-nucleotide pyrophosphorylase (carboxylating)